MTYFDELQINPLALSLLIPVVLSLFVAHEAWRKEYGVRGRTFSLAMTSVIIWSLAYGLELSSTTYESMMFWLKIEYLAIPFVTPLMLLVIFQLIDRDNGLPHRIIRFLFVIPIITMILALSNDYHHLYYKEVFLQQSTTMPTLKLSFGIWYFVHVFYSYSLVIAGLVALFRRIFYIKSYFRYQRISMVVAVLIPIISFTIYFLGLMPVENLDPTPFAFSLSGLAFSVSILKFRFLNVVPIARDHIFHSMVDGIVVIDNTNKVIDCNPSGLEIFQWDQMPISSSVVDLWSDNTLLIGLIQSKSNTTIEVEISLKSEIRSYLVTTSEIRTQNKGKVGMLFVFHDNTIRNQLQSKIASNEKSLARINAEKDKLFAVISHDLRGPISSYIGLTDMFLDDSFDLTREEMKNMAQSMNKSARSLQGLVENLLEWSRMQKEEVIILKESLNLRITILQAMETIEDIYKNKEIEIEVEVGESTWVVADEHLLLSILRNLTTNAIKFTERKGKILISANEIPNGFIQINVIDNGIGIRKDMIEKLFFIEKMVGRPGTEGEASSGLGLLLCKDFVEKQGGKIWVESVEKKGSIFSFTLPKPA
jgi:signal transduction histidine kinase